MKEHDEISKLAKFGSKMPKIVRNIALQTFAMLLFAVVIDLFFIEQTKISFKMQIVH